MALLFKNLLFTLLVPGTFAVYLPLAMADGRPIASGLVFVLGAIGLALGTFIYAWCVWDFATFGRGTPAPIDAPKRLVVRGLYRYTRNPMYTGVMTVILSWAVIFQSVDLWIYALVVWACFQAFILLYEEPHLRGEFGADYAEYSRRVGRWGPRLRAPSTDEA